MSAAAETQSKQILLAGGGSGGHIAPALAVAEQVLLIDEHAKIHAACSTRSIDQRMLHDANISFTQMPAAPLRKSARGVAHFIRQYRRARREASALIAERKITDVFSTGGFVAAPVVAAAKRLGLRVVMLNIDDPPGRANRLIAPRCDVVLSTTCDRVGRQAAKRVGAPLRQVTRATGDVRASRKHLGLAPDIPTLLVTGASQGATSLNDMMIRLAETETSLFAGWQVLHLAGADQDEQVQAAYDTAGIRAVVCGFVKEMGRAYDAADLAISRAGANSVLELHASAVPTIFLPYPYHRDQHQRLNAGPMVNAGGAVLFEDQINATDNARDMVPVLGELLGDSDKRQSMHEALTASRPVDGAAAIARLLLN